MTPTPLRSLFLLALAVVACVTWPAAAHTCPFCSGQGQTLTGDVNQASMVLFGTLANARLNPNDDFGGSTDLTIEAVLKKHEILGDRKVLTLPRYVPEDKKLKFLIFCDVFKGKIDPYRGLPVAANSDIVKYLQGALDLKGKPVADQLLFFFDYLDNADTEVANDAYREFANADYKDFRGMTGKLPADKVARWLEDANTPAFRHGLYASMLGHCGKEKHADVLRKMLDDPQKQLSSGIDGVLAGYMMLKPKDGWTYLRGVLKDPSKEFMIRYAALRALRFFWEYRPDVVGKKELAEGASLLLDQGDIADLAIEDLRKWGREDLIDKVLSLFDLKTHDVPIIRRSILRFALSFPNNEKAAAFIAKMRKLDLEMVKDVEELLAIEATPKPKAPTESK